VTVTVPDRKVGLSAEHRRCGETHHNAKISDDMVRLLRDLHGKGDSPRTLHGLFPELKLRTIRAIVYFERRATLPVEWRSQGPSDEQRGTD